MNILKSILSKFRTGLLEDPVCGAMDHMHGTENSMDMSSGMDHMHGTGTPMDMNSMPGHGDHGGSGSMEHMMYMFFHCSKTATVLFKGWHVDTAGAWVGTCLAIFIMAMLYEGLKVLRETLLRRSIVNVRYQSTELSKDSKTVLTETHGAGEPRLWSWGHVLQTFLHMIQVTVSYFLMLIFMTYNVYLCIPVVVGAGFGYFAFGWKRSIVVDVNEHCH